MLYLGKQIQKAMHYFYSRISTASQNSSRQLATFQKEKEYDSKNVYLDTVQGNVPFLERTEAGKLFDHITNNNDGNVTVWIIRTKLPPRSGH